MSKILVIATAFIVCFGLFSYVNYQYNSFPDPVVIDSRGQPTLGEAGAPVHLISFQDFKCAGCKYFADEIYPKIKKKYIDTGKVKFTLIPIAFLSGSKRVAHAALSAYRIRPESFFPFVERLYEVYSWDFPKWSSTENLVFYAKHTGKIDPYRFQSTLNHWSSASILNANFKLAKRALKNKLSTPALFVDGVEMPPFSFSSISKQIDRRLWENDQQH